MANHFPSKWGWWFQQITWEQTAFPMGTSSFSEVEDWGVTLNNEWFLIMEYYRAKPSMDSKNTMLELLENYGEQNREVFISWNLPLWYRGKSSHQIYNLVAFSPILWCLIVDRYWLQKYKPSSLKAPHFLSCCITHSLPHSFTHTDKILKHLQAPSI